METVFLNISGLPIEIAQKIRVIAAVEQKGKFSPMAAELINEAINARNSGCVINTAIPSNTIAISVSISGITAETFQKIREISESEFNGKVSPTVCNLLAEALEARKNKVLAEAK